MDNHITIDGIDIHYVDWPGEGKPIVCVHGLTANCRYFDSLGERLSPQYRVIAYDLRGRGNSGKPQSGYNPIRHAADLEEFLDALSLKEVVLLGHSLGAAIVAFFAAHFPARVDRLILMDGGGGGPQADYDTVLKTIQPMVDRLRVKYQSLEEYLGAVKLTYGGDWTKYMEGVYTYDAGKNSDGSISPKMTPEAALEDFFSLRSYDMVSNLGRVQCPSLFLRAPEGFLGGPPICPREAAELLAGVIPDCQLVDVEGTNHATILLGEGDTTSEAIRAFLTNSSVGA